MVGLLWHGICPSKGLYLHKTTQTQRKCRHTTVPRRESKPQSWHLVCSSHTSHSTVKVFSTPVTSYTNYITDRQNTPITVMHSHINPLNTELNPICYLLALLAHHFLHVSRIRVKSLTLTLLKSCIYGAPILDVSRSHTTTHHSW